MALQETRPGQRPAHPQPGAREYTVRNGGIVLVGHQSHQAPPRADADSAWEWHHAVVAADPRHVWRAVVAILVMLVIALGMLAGGLWLLWSEWSQSGPVG